MKPSLAITCPQEVWIIPVSEERNSNRKNCQPSTAKFQNKKVKAKISATLQLPPLELEEQRTAKLLKFQSLGEGSRRPLRTGIVPEGLGKGPSGAESQTLQGGPLS